MAVLECAQHVIAEINAPQLGHAVHHDQDSEVDATKVVVATRGGDEVEHDVLWA